MGRGGATRVCGGLYRQLCDSFSVNASTLDLKTLKATLVSHLGNSRFAKRYLYMWGIVSVALA